MGESGQVFDVVEETRKSDVSRKKKPKPKPRGKKAVITRIKKAVVTPKKTESEEWVDVANELIKNLSKQVISLTKQVRDIRNVQIEMFKYIEEMDGRLFDLVNILTEEDLTEEGKEPAADEPSVESSLSSLKRTFSALRKSKALS